MKPKKHSFFRHALLVVFGLILGVNVYFSNAKLLVGNALPMPFGTGAAVVLSGSMEPTLSKGDLIFVRKSDIIEQGDIVVYQSGSSLIMHRVVQLDGTSVVTQGDANNVPDEPIQTAQIKGVVIGWIPAVGILFNALKTPVGAFITLLAAVALIELSFRKQKDEDDKTLSEVKEEIRRLKEELEQQDK